MEDYLIRGGCDDATLTLSTGEQVIGEDLISLVEQNRKARSMIGTLSKNVPEKIIEQMAISGLFDHQLFNDIPALKKSWKNWRLALMNLKLNMTEAGKPRFRVMVPCCSSVRCAVLPKSIVLVTSYLKARKLRRSTICATCFVKTLVT